jgi:hypothetical protein
MVAPSANAQASRIGGWGSHLTCFSHDCEVKFRIDALQFFARPPTYVDINRIIVENAAVENRNKRRQTQPARMAAYISFVLRMACRLLFRGLMRKYLRFISGLHEYLRERLEPSAALEQARIQLQKRIANRDRNFLNLLEKGIFGHASSPYLGLLQSRNIDFADVKKWVEGEGIENTLVQLRDEGIYFTVDEFKGKKEVNRNGIRFKCHERMFDNPFLSNFYEVRSGATRSAGTRVRIDFEYLKQRSLYDALLLQTHDILTAPIANWFPIFPGAPGMNSSLRFMRIGNAPRRWFSQVSQAQVDVNWEKSWGTQLIFMMAKLYGAPLATPDHADLNSAHLLAEWAAEMLKESPSCAIYTFASSAVRVCIAARERGLDIKGTRFLVTGEPLTAQKKKEIEESGAIAVPVYGISEAGVIAAGCNHAHDFPLSDFCHVYKDTTAIITHRLSVPHIDLEVDTFLFSTLLYESPKLLLNVGMGDYGMVRNSPCDCEFGKLGFDSHIGHIRSYEKLTGEGVTFVDTDLIRILEKDLPTRFGGRSTDYQLVEQENGAGLNHLRLLVSPRLGALDDRRIAHDFIELLRRAEDSPESWAQSGSLMWNQVGMVRVERTTPIPTISGKILPFHMVKPPAEVTAGKE